MINIVKDTIRVGNGAGVLLPKEWLGGKVEVSLVKKPMNIKEEIFKAINPLLDDVIGIYLTGSYARGEQEPDSDIDVLVVTGNTNAVKKKGKIHIIIVSLEQLNRNLKENLISVLPIIKEGKPILNKSLLEKLKRTQITSNGLKWHIDTSKSALGIVRCLLNLEGEIVKSTAIVYSLILRLREAYIAECLLKNKAYSNKNFKILLNKLFDREKAEEIIKVYKAERDETKMPSHKIKREELERLYGLVKLMIKKQEQGLWGKEKKD